MANESDHIALANRNHTTLDYLLEDELAHPEWIATVSFYMALQLVEAVFSNDSNIRSRTSHNLRLEELKARPKYRAIYPHYRVLWQASTVARYLYDRDAATGYSCFTDYLAADQVKEKIVHKRLRAVEQNCLQFLSGQAKSDLQRLPSN